MYIGTKVSTTFGGKTVYGTIVGKHGSSDYFAVKLDSSEVIYRWAADIEKV